MDLRNINILVLAYIGDSIYEVYVREKLIKDNIANVNDLQKESINYVSAINQSQFLKDLLDKNFFTNDELDIIKKGRNYKSSRHPKNCDIITYKHATALESLIGYLYLSNNKTRLDEIMKEILK